MTDRVAVPTDVVSLAAVFGLASVPWTYAFVAGLDWPLWPSFVAAASYYAAGGGIEGLRLGYAGNLVGIGYAATTVAVVDGLFGGGVLALSVGMFIASLHPLVEPLGFAPSAFLGYATLFGLHAAGTGVLLGGLAGETVAAVGAMLVGAAIGYGVDLGGDRLARTRRPAVEG